ncbi:hypothetical protein IFU01_18310 [Oxalobacteraceae sp. CFBP 8763]|nr:hypothetical protein [Oxalobacteraceae sp. CFBP 8763]
MNIATLYVYGADANLDRLTELLGSTGTSRWKVGDRLHSGKLHQCSGIAFDLPDSDTPRNLVDEVRRCLSCWHTKGISLAGLNFVGELSFGITVGDSVQFTAHVEFSAVDMLALGSIGIALSIAAYPTSDEANEFDT